MPGEHDRLAVAHVSDACATQPRPVVLLDPVVIDQGQHADAVRPEQRRDLPTETPNADDRDMPIGQQRGRPRAQREVLPPVGRAVPTGRLLGGGTS